MARLMRTGRVGVSPVGPTGSKKVVYVVPAAKSVRTIVRWCLLLFVFTIPFETAQVGFTSSSFSLAKAAGFLFFVSCLVTSKSYFRCPRGAIWWFVGYLTVFSLNGLFIPEDFSGEFVSSFLRLAQLIILCWVASNLLREEKLARDVLLTFAAASVILALGMILKLPGFAVSLSAEGRMTALGANANGLAINMALATLMLMNLQLEKGLQGFWRKAAAVILTLPPLAAIMHTGSRTGIGALVLGVSLYLLPYRSPHRKRTAMLWALLAIVVIVYMIAGDPAVSSRWSDAYYKGDTSGRDSIYEAALDMIAEQPLFGWQPIRHAYELGRRVHLQHARDAHNLYLHLLTEVGFLGTVPFMVGLFFCVRAAWRAREGGLGLLPLALLASVLASSMSNNPVVDKPMWLILSLTLAATSFSARRQSARSGVLLAGLRQLSRHGGEREGRSVRSG